MGACLLPAVQEREDELPRRHLEGGQLVRSWVRLERMAGGLCLRRVIGVFSGIQPYRVEKAVTLLNVPDEPQNTLFTAYQTGQSCALIASAGVGDRGKPYEDFQLGRHNGRVGVRNRSAVFDSSLLTVSCFGSVWVPCSDTGQQLT